MDMFFFGPLGAFRPLQLERGMSRTASRGRGQFVTSGGVRFSQVGRAAPREWSSEMALQDPHAVSLLQYAAQGIVKDCYLYDVFVARENLLRSSECVGSGASVLVDGVPLGSLASGTGPRAYLLAGRTVTISCWTNVIAGANVLTVTHDGNTVTLAAPPGTGSRYTYATYTPMDDGVLTTQVTGTLSGLRIHEGAPDRSFQATQGTPCLVDVNDPEETLRKATRGETLIDYSVTLQEVGQPTF